MTYYRGISGGLPRDEGHHYKMATKKAVTGAVATPKKARRSKTKLDISSLDVSLGYSLRRAQLSTFEGFLESAGKFDVRPSQYAVLVLIRSNPGLTQSAVSDALGIQKANFVALLDKLEARGLTERRRSGGDRRSSALHLTVEGEAFVKKLEAAHRAGEKKLAMRLGKVRSAQMLEMLHEFCGKR